MKKVFFASVIVTTTLLALYFFFSWLFPPLCENAVERTLLTDNNQQKIVLFKRGCGATTGDSLHISILSTSDEIDSDDIGNVIIADYTGYEAKLDGLHFSVTLFEQVRLYKSEKNYENIIIQVSQPTEVE